MNVESPKIRQGQTISKEYRITDEIHEIFSELFGDRNPLHVDDKYAVSKGFHAKVVHGAVLGGFLSNFIGMELPYKNVVIHSLEIDFVKPNYVGDYLRIEARVDQVSEAVKVFVLKINIMNLMRGYVCAKAKVQVGIL
ncbi:MAG: hypothetical protein A3D87_03560 [Omnitrophica WOR_2 bacterium RIFCSPHIGHO2_02_FULL_50_17]|nr:MAG: hypothetical protein A3D87_03560 [Omnitrophica WOR_2 bacterium RIFCSPHIGHO2_02_FULL_50_17]